MNCWLIAAAPALLMAGSTVSAQALPPPVAGPTSAQVQKSGQTEDIRLKQEVHERMTVPVRLSGAGPYYFLVDTGADRTAISRDLAIQLKLASGESAQLHSITGVSTVTTATVPDLQLTRKPVRIEEAPLLNARDMGADGILGVDSLGTQRVVFDFVGQTMSVVPSSVSEPWNEPGAIVIKARRRNGRLIITQATTGGHNVTIVLDTGAEVTIGNDALRRQLRLGQGAPGGRAQLQSVTGGNIEGDVMRLATVVIGGVTLSNLVVVFADAHTFKQLGLDNKPALLLGMNAMRAFKKVSIDFANRRFRVVLPEESKRDLRVASAR